MSEQSAKRPLEGWVSYRFGLIAARIGAFAAPMYKERHGLTLPAWRALAVIARFQPLSAGELASHSSLDPFRVARVIDRLLTNGLIERELDPADRRRASLRLTEQGRIVHNDIDLFASRLDGLLTSSLTARESAMLDSILTKINVQLRDIIENHRWQDYIDPD